MGTKKAAQKENPWNFHGFSDFLQGKYNEKSYDLLLTKILADQHLQQFIPIDFADQGAGVVVVGDIGGVLGKNVSHNLIDGIIALFFQCLIDSGQNLADFLILFYCNAELPGKIVHADTTFLLRENSLNINTSSVYSLFFRL
jgi:hypothetical protein